MQHRPVLLQEMLASLQPAAGEIYVDGTFGAGGYSRAILESADCKVYGIDRDPSAKAFAKLLEQDFPDRFMLIEGRFSEMESLLSRYGITKVNGIVLDIGVSSMQIDDAARGFSFRFDGPLDMRMGSHGTTAEQFVNSAGEEELAHIIYTYGEERASRRVARAIVREREKAPITRTGQLAEIVRGALRGGGKDKIDPSTRTFQALRIHINDELGELEQALETASRLLIPGGRLVVVTFHSLEDRIVKQHLLERSGRSKGVSRHHPSVQTAIPPTFLLTTRKAITPGDSEQHENPRARSAKLRAAIRLEDAP